MKLSNVGKKFKNIVLSNVDLEITNAGLYSIIGESGSGKSTLLNIISGLDTDFSGERKNDGTLSYSRQETSLFENLTLKENIELLVSFKKINYNVMKLFGLENQLSEKICDLSGGQKTRAELLKSYILDAEVVIVDEPTSNLDQKNAEKIIGILNFFSEDKIVIVSTHDQNIINISSRVFEIKDKKITIIKNIDTNNVIKKKSRKDKEFKTTKIVKLLFKDDRQFYISQVLILILFMIGFTVLNCFIFNIFSAGYNAMIGAYDEDTIRVNSSKFTEEDFGKSERDKIFFSEQDIMDLKESDNIKDAFLYSSNVVSNVDQYGNLPDIQDGGNVYLFNELVLPLESLDYYNQYGVEIIGTDPKDENDIIIPSELCDYLKKDCSEVINKPLELPVSQGDMSIFEYDVVGYYDSENDFSNASFIYTKYQVSNATEQDIVGSYEGFNNVDKLYSDQVGESFESYKRAYGSGIGSILVVNEENKQSEALKEIEEFCPYCTVETNKSVLESSKKKLYTMGVIFFTCEVLVVAVMVLIYHHIFKSFNMRKRKSKFKLKLMNYCEKDIKKLIFFENGFKFMLSSLPSFTYLIVFQPSLIIIFYTCILVITLFSSYLDIKKLDGKYALKILNKK